MSIILGDDAKILLKTSSTIAYMSALVFSLLHNTGGLVPPSTPYININNYKQRRYIVIKIKPWLHPVIIITWASYKCRHCDSWVIRLGQLWHYPRSYMSVIFSVYYSLHAFINTKTPGCKIGRNNPKYLLGNIPGILPNEMPSNQNIALSCKLKLVLCELDEVQPPASSARSIACTSPN